MIISKAKISSKFQITLPIRIVKKLNLQPGDVLSFDEESEKIHIIPDTKDFSVLDLTKKYQHISSAKPATADDVKKSFETGLSQRNQNL